MSTVAAPSVPMYQQGWAPHLRRAPVLANLSRAPKIPLYQLGWLGAAAPMPAGAGTGPGILAATAPIDAKVTTALLTPDSGSNSGGSNSSSSGWAGAAGVAVSVLVGVIAGLWAAHNARVKGAKQENQAINSAVQTFDAGLKAIFAAANSSDPTQNVSASTAAQQVQQLWAQFWAEMQPYTHAPGAADASGGGANCGSGLNPAGPCQGTPGGHMCDKSCTATCCVGCQDLYPTMLQALQVFQAGGGSVTACTVYGSKYGAVQRSGYTLTYTPPTITAASTVSGLLADLTGGSGGGSSSGLLIVAAIAAAFFFLH